MTVSAGAGSEDGARLLRGAPIAAEIKTSVTAEVAAFRGRYGFAPTLAVVIVGRDAPSAVYLEQILRTCARSGSTAGSSRSRGASRRAGSATRSSS